MANAIDVKKYFGYPSASDFAKDWRNLTDADKKELTTLLQAEIDAGRFVAASPAAA